MNKKYYEQPKIEVIQFLTDDILTSSAGGEDTDIDVGNLFG